MQIHNIIIEKDSRSFICIVDNKNHLFFNNLVCLTLKCQLRRVSHSEAAQKKFSEQEISL